MPITYLDDEPAKITYLDDAKQPMFSSEEEGRKATAKAIGIENRLRREAEHPYITAVGKTLEDFPAFANKAINTALPVFSAADVLTGGRARAFLPTAEQEAANPLAGGTAEGLGFVAPGGLPMRAMKAAEVISNPLTRNVAQGALAMATQIPTADKKLEEYASGVALGGASGVAGRGIEKVIEGAIPQTAKALSGRIHDYLVKMPVGSFKFSKNPINVMADERIVAGNMGEYAEKSAERLAQRTDELNKAVAGSKKTVNISEMVDNHFKSAASKLTGSLKDRTTQLKELETIRENLTAKYGDLKKMSIADAIKFKRQLADDFPFTQEGAGDITTKAAHQIYHDINNHVEVAQPEIAELNQRVSGLIDITAAARNRMAVENRNNPVGLVGRMAGIGAAGIGVGAGQPVEGIIGGLAIMGIEKVVQSPAVLTRVASILSAMGGKDRLAVLTAYPQLKAVIKPVPGTKELAVVPSSQIASNLETLLKKATPEEKRVIRRAAELKPGSPVDNPASQARGQKEITKNPRGSRVIERKRKE